MRRETRREMNILLVHQNFPGQYRELFRWLVDQRRHNVVFLTQRADVGAIEGAEIVVYKPHHRAANDAYALSAYWEDCAGNGYGAAKACETLREDGFRPDIILGHVGWGELTFVKQVWPDVPVIGLFEYFFLATGGSVGFDPEFPAGDQAPYTMHARNAVNFANIQTVDLGYAPTRWQRDTYPPSFHEKLYVCHDGIRTDLLRPDPKASISLGRLDRPLTRQDEVVTYVARNLEPVRGFHILMRALPEILDARPGSRVVIVGGNGASYGRASDEHGGYRGMLERELGHRIDWDRVHFVGRVPYASFRSILQVSRCHVYLTVPFVPSWSLLEAMSMGATVVASDVPPVREIVTDGETGHLVDFLDPAALAARVVDVLARPGDHAPIGRAARDHVRSTYDFNTCALPTHVSRINDLVAGTARLSMA